MALATEGNDIEKSKELLPPPAACSMFPRGAEYDHPMEIETIMRTVRDTLLPGETVQLHSFSAVNARLKHQGTKNIQSTKARAIRTGSQTPRGTNPYWVKKSIANARHDDWL
ncbi:hypothetical protein BBP40_005877 [Aspergillus hancockii]|nr:hypothetical protein BBP40_005877 [Aspergillus hancockii]